MLGWMLNGRGSGQVKERQGRGRDGGNNSSPPPSFIFQPVILSLGVPFDSFKPSVCFPIQDGSRNSQTNDYSVLAPHKICLHCRLKLCKLRTGHINGTLILSHLPLTQVVAYLRCGFFELILFFGIIGFVTYLRQEHLLCKDRFSLCELMPVDV